MPNCSLRLFSAILFTGGALVFGQISSSNSAPPFTTLASPTLSDSNSLSSPLATRDSLLSLFEINAKGTFSKSQVHSGDTLSYTVEVNWQGPKIPFTVLAPESLSFRGLTQTQVVTKHQKLAGQENGLPILKNQSLYIYTLKANFPGRGIAEGGYLPYFLLLGDQQRESFGIPSSIVNILPPYIPFYKRWWFLFLIGVLILGFSTSALLKAKKYFEWKKKQSKAPVSSIGSELDTLRKRLDTASSPELLKSMELLAIQALKEKFPNLKATQFEMAYQEIQGSLTDSEKSHWDKLQHPFQLLHYGAGQIPNHQVREVFNLLKQCIPDQRNQT